MRTRPSRSSRPLDLLCSLGSLAAGLLVAGCGAPPSLAGGSPSPAPDLDAASDAPDSGQIDRDTGASPVEAGRPPVTTDAAPSSSPDSGAGTPDAAAPDAGPPPGTSTARVVAYLPNYSGSYADWARQIDFSKMTHLNLAFATANAGNGWDMGASDSDVKALVLAAHAANVKVIASLGGGGGDQTVISQYRDPGNIPALVSNLDTFLSSHDLDGADVDIEDGSNLGSNYSQFVDAMVSTLRPEGKLVTAAVAQYLQDSMSDTTLHQFDFVNVMVYSNYADGVSAMDYYTNTKSVPAGQVVLGAAFFGSDSGGTEYGYADILKADPNAWSKDQTNVNGQTVNYTGMATMKEIADYAKGFGGIMFWELTLDTTDSHSLYKVIQGEN